jgi:hypothetical protein
MASRTESRALAATVFALVEMFIVCLLVNTAGIMATPYELTGVRPSLSLFVHDIYLFFMEDGIEIQF